MRLAILAQAYLLDPTAPINGTFVQLHNLSQGFAKSGLEVHYIATSKDDTKPEKEVIDGIHFHWIYSNNGILEWHTNMKRYKAILEVVQPEAIYVRGRSVLQYIAGKYASKHKINFVWGTNGEDSAELWKNVKRLRDTNKSLIKKITLFPFKTFEDSYINKGMKKPSSIINQSVHQQEETKRLLNREGVVLPSYFIKTERQTGKENTILWLANLSPNKQPNLFVELIRGSNLNDWNAVLGGGTSDKNYERQIENSIGEIPVLLKGKIDFKDSFDYYSKSKIYINTSKPDADGLPNAYLQSWLNGTVVLSLNHDPNSWMEIHNIGYCAHGDFEALQLKLQQLVNDPNLLQIMSDNAVKFAEETFASQLIIDEYIKLFKDGKTNLI